MKQFLIILSIVLVACKKPVIEKPPATEYDEKGTLISKPYLWKKNIFVDCDEPMTGHIYQNTHYNGAALVVKKYKNEFYLCLMDTINGSCLWETLLESYPPLYSIGMFYVNENYLYSIFEKTGFARVNLDNGTMEKIPYDENTYLNYALNGIDNYLFFSASDSFPNVSYNYTSHGYVLNTKDLSIEQFLTPPYHIPENVDYNKFAKRIGGLYPYTLNGEIVLYVDYHRSYTNADYWDLFNSNFQNYFGIYSFTKDKWLYDSITIDDSYGQAPYINNGYIWSYSTEKAYCHELISGNLIWEKKYSGAFDPVINNTTYGNIYVLLHKSGFLIGLDKDTGQEQWRTPSSNTVSYFQEYNGVLYYVNFGRGKIHAVDIETGKMLWRLNYPDPTGFGYCTVIPGKDGGKGRIIACTLEYAYCYETER